MPMCFEVLNVPGFRYFSTFSKSCCAWYPIALPIFYLPMYSLILGRSYQKFPVVILCCESLYINRWGIRFFRWVCSACFNYPFRTKAFFLSVLFFSCSCSVSSNGKPLSSKSTCPRQYYAKWQAILDPITPEPKNGYFLISSFHFFGFWCLWLVGLLFNIQLLLFLRPTSFSDWTWLYSPWSSLEYRKNTSNSFLRYYCSYLLG